MGKRKRKKTVRTPEYKQLMKIAKKNPKIRQMNYNQIKRELAKKGFK